MLTEWFVAVGIHREHKGDEWKETATLVYAGSSMFCASRECDIYLRRCPEDRVKGYVFDRYGLLRQCFDQGSKPSAFDGYNYGRNDSDEVWGPIAKAMKLLSSHLDAIPDEDENVGELGDGGSGDGPKAS
jgi:hypothetical protein